MEDVTEQRNGAAAIMPGACEDPFDVCSGGGCPQPGTQCSAWRCPQLRWMAGQRGRRLPLGPCQLSENSRHRGGSVTAAKDPVSWGSVGNHGQAGGLGQWVSTACTGSCPHRTIHSPRDISVPACACGGAGGNSQSQAAAKPLTLANAGPHSRALGTGRKGLCGHPAPFPRAQNSSSLKRPLDSGEVTMSTKGNDPGGSAISCHSSKVCVEC